MYHASPSLLQGTSGTPSYRVRCHAMLSPWQRPWAAGTSGATSTLWRGQRLVSPSSSLIMALSIAARWHKLLHQVEAALMPIDQLLLWNLDILAGQRGRSLCDQPTGEGVRWVFGSQFEDLFQHSSHVPWKKYLGINFKKNYIVYHSASPHDHHVINHKCFTFVTNKYDNIRTKREDYPINHASIKSHDLSHMTQYDQVQICSILSCLYVHNYLWT